MEERNPDDAASTRTLYEVLASIHEYDEAEAVYVAKGAPLTANTPAVVSSEWRGRSQMEREPGFSYLGDVGGIRWVVSDFPSLHMPQELSRLICELENPSGV